MKSYRLILLIVVTLYRSASLGAQIEIQAPNGDAVYPYGIKNSLQWNAVQNHWEERNFQLTFLMKSGERESGQILYTEEDGLYFWKANSEFINPLQLEEKTGYLKWNEIEKIEYHNYWRNSAGIKKGVLWGGTAGLLVGAYFAGYFNTALSLGLGLTGVGFPMMSYIENHHFNPPVNTRYGDDIQVQELNKLALFPEQLPPSLKTSEEGLRVRDNLGTFLPVKSLFKASPHAKKVFSQPRISVFPHLILSSMNNMVGHQGIAAACNVNHRNSIVYHYNDMDHYISERNSFISLTNWVKFKTHGISYSYKALSRGEFQFRKFEISMSGGLTYNLVSNELSYSFNGLSGGEVINYDATLDTNIFGWKIQGSINYYLSRYMSLGFNYGVHTMWSAISIPEHKQLHPETNTLKGFDAHELMLSSRDLLIGIQVHF